MRRIAVNIAKLPVFFAKTDAGRRPADDYGVLRSLICLAVC
jgi:hypothetical protein